MQRCLLHRGIPALTASVGNRVLPSLRLRPFTQQEHPIRPTVGLHSSLQAASVVGEAPSTDLGAQTGLPEIIETSNVPVYLYLKSNEMEAEALKQLIALAESPLPVGYVSAMPDAHVGKGVSIGTVFASERYVAPMAVGVDIGCGMCAVPFNGLHKDDLRLKDLQKIQKMVKERIPTGPNLHSKPLAGAQHTLEDISKRHAPSAYLLGTLQESKKAARQLGTLGGGNHFLELVYDETGRVWIMLHSGSRNIGKTTAEHYDELARRLLGGRGIKSFGGALHYLEVDSEEGQAYLQDMQWCQEYAFQNRRAMLDLMIDVVEEVGKSSPDMDQSVNIHHNFCQCERCSYTDPRSGEVVEKELYVTRKGATPAAEGQMGLIPGSMGTGSFVTRGRGNSKSWSSCSHGAGRRMSRTQAKKRITEEEFAKAMQGIVCDSDKRVIDEAPQAYKDLTKVMANQASLTDVVHRLKPLVNVKGF